LEENNHRVKWLSEKGTVLAASLVAIIIIIGGVIIFHSTRYEKNNTFWDGIPENAAVVLSVKDI